MKLKNVVVGSEIEAKCDTRFVTKGEIVKVIYKEDSDYEYRPTLKLENSKGEKLWSNHKYFRRPRPKKLDQSIFKWLDEKWRFAVIDKNGTACKFTNMPNPQEKYEQFMYDNTVSGNEHEVIAKGYDATDWQNSLIERESKELLEVDLSSELTGSDLCRKMLERGDRYVMCIVNENNNSVQIISGCTEHGFTSRTNPYCLFKNPIPINNQGEPLTAKDVGL